MLVWMCILNKNVMAKMWSCYVSNGSMHCLCNIFLLFISKYQVLFMLLLVTTIQCVFFFLSIIFLFQEAKQILLQQSQKCPDMTTVSRIGVHLGL